MTYDQCFIAAAPPSAVGSRNRPATAELIAGWRELMAENREL